MTDLTKILSHLPDTKIRELETITQRIVDTEKAEIVVLFGSYARGNYKEKRGKIQGKKSDYDILLVVSEYETKKELSSELRTVFKDISVHVQLIVEDINYVNSSLEEKQFFFTDIKREGKVLFNSGNFELSNSKELTPKRRREIATKYYEAFKGKDFILGQSGVVEGHAYHLYVVEKINNGVRRAEREGTLTQEEVERKFAKWTT